jgi:hypothetical protein
LRLDALARGADIDRVTTSQRKILLDAMKAAARKRALGVTGEKRRRHYGHAATLVACCVELEGGAAASDWLAEIRAQTSRFYAFREELARALDVSTTHSEAY